MTNSAFQHLSAAQRSSACCAVRLLPFGRHAALTLAAMTVAAASSDRAASCVMTQADSDSARNMCASQA